MGLLKLESFSSVSGFLDNFRLRQKQRDDDRSQSVQDIVSFRQDRIDFIRENGNLIAVSDVATGNTTKILHTVSANSIFYLLVVAFGGDNNNASADVTAWFQINASELFPLLIDGDTVNNSQITFSNPIKLTAGETISIKSNNGNLLVRGGIVGYEILEADVEDRLEIAR